LKFGRPAGSRFLPSVGMTRVRVAEEGANVCDERTVDARPW
jgi:hypothetical protein